MKKLIDKNGIELGGGETVEIDEPKQDAQL